MLNIGILHLLCLHNVYIYVMLNVYVSQCLLIASIVVNYVHRIIVAIRYMYRSFILTTSQCIRALRYMNMIHESDFWFLKRGNVFIACISNAGPNAHWYTPTYQNPLIRKLPVATRLYIWMKCEVKLLAFNPLNTWHFCERMEHKHISIGLYEV